MRKTLTAACMAAASFVCVTGTAAAAQSPLPVSTGSGNQLLVVGDSSTPVQLIVTNQLGNGDTYVCATVASSDGATLLDGGVSGGPEPLDAGGNLGAVALTPTGPSLDGYNPCTAYGAAY